MYRLILSRAVSLLWTAKLVVGTHFDLSVSKYFHPWQVAEICHSSNQNEVQICMFCSTQRHVLLLFCSFISIFLIKNLSILGQRHDYLTSCLSIGQCLFNFETHLPLENQQLSTCCHLDFSLFIFFIQSAVYLRH